tara:strand:+ start:71 stop:718 length:648 start_codon:yes stop_codon:yes gene_type:complete
MKQSWKEILRSIDNQIAKTYNKRFLKLGPTPEASMWFSKNRQFTRFDTILKEIRLLTGQNQTSIIDIGCGYGAFLEFLSERCADDIRSYYGYDISHEVIKFCKKKYSQGPVFYTGSIPTFTAEFIIMSGTYNFFPSKDYNSWNLYFYGSLKTLWSKATRAMIFNLQTSDQEKITDGGIVYASKKEIENYCKANFGNVKAVVNPIISKDVTFVVKK